MLLRLGVSQVWIAALVVCHEHAIAFFSHEPSALAHASGYRFDLEASPLRRLLKFLVPFLVIYIRQQMIDLRRLT